MHYFRFNENVQLSSRIGCCCWFCYERHRLVHLHLEMRASSSMRETAIHPHSIGVLIPSKRPIANYSSRKSANPSSLFVPLCHSFHILFIIQRSPGLLFDILADSLRLSTILWFVDSVISYFDVFGRNFTTLEGSLRFFDIIVRILRDWPSIIQDYFDTRADSLQLLMTHSDSLTSLAILTDFLSFFLSVYLFIYFLFQMFVYDTLAQKFVRNSFLSP